MMNDADMSGVVAGRRKAYRDTLFQRWVEAKREAQESEVQVDHGRVVEAYLAFMRAHLAEDEVTLLDLENEVARLRAENARLRARPTSEAA